MIDYSVFDGKRAAFFTLGCKLNFAETSTLGEMLMSHGVATPSFNPRSSVTSQVSVS